ncbi:Penicillin-binding protein 4 [bacterium HR39]|nr:Penicillin-binding protein 4 [bacterium HR39]
MVLGALVLVVLVLLLLPPPARLLDPAGGPAAPGLVLRAADGSTLLAEDPAPGPPADPPSLVRAAFEAALGELPRGVPAVLGTPCADGGASGPLSLRLADTLLAGDPGSSLRCLRVRLAALWFELGLSPEEHLRAWLARARIGTAFGVERAARRYFGRPARELDPLQAAMLAGLAGLPPHLSPLHTPATARRRAREVLLALAARGVLSPAEAERWARATLHLGRWPESGRDAVDAALRDLVRFGPPAGELVAETAVDPALQRAVERAVARHLAGLPQVEAAVVVLDPGGQIAALFGGRARIGPNRALDLPRQPGSAFKLLVYAAALEAGWRPDDPIEDAPVVIDGWSPGNVDGRFHGTVTLERAFAHSYNAAAVRLQERVGRARIVRLARALGIRAPLAPLPSLALGTRELTPLELARATWALVHGRTTTAPTVVRVWEAGRRAFETAEAGAAVPVSRGTRESLKRMMRAAVRSGTAREAAVPGLDVGAKTGTSQDGRDGWIAGFAGDHVIAVWVGRDDARPVPDLAGGGVPARIFRDVAASLTTPGS